MQLDRLQKRGVIHIGLKKSKTVLYAYSHPARPGQIAVGHAAEGVRSVNGSPVIPSVARHYDTDGAKPRFIMICHHSSGKQIARKIQTALEDRLGEREGDAVWIAASLEEVIYAYPPFAKIFLSELPKVENEIGDAKERDGDDLGEAAERGGGGGGSAHGRGRIPGGGEDPDGPPLKDHLLLKTDGARTCASLLLILGIVFMVGYLALSTLKSDENGQRFLWQIEKWTGLSVLGDDARASLISRADSGQAPASADGAIPTGEASMRNDFAAWYDVFRENDAGLTFGLPRETRGFRVKTWVDGAGEDRRLFAAYRAVPEHTYLDRSSTQERASRQILGSHLRVSRMAFELHSEACAILQSASGKRALGGRFQRADLVIVHDRLILTAFAADSTSCATGQPAFQPLPNSAPDAK